MKNKLSLKFIRQWSQPFNTQKWLTCNFSQQYPYIIQQTGSEITQVQDIILIEHQIPVINSQGNV